MRDTEEKGSRIVVRVGWSSDEPVWKERCCCPAKETSNWIEQEGGEGFGIGGLTLRTWIGDG